MNRPADDGWRCGSAKPPSAVTARGAVYGVLNGPNPRPAPDRPALKPDWDPKNGGWEPGDGWKTIVGALDMLNLAGNDQYTPDQAPTTHPAPGTGTGPGSGSGRDNSQDCRRGGSGWGDYGKLDTAHGNRATTTAVRSATGQNHIVQYSVQPSYTDNRVVASSWTFNATAWDAQGKRDCKTFGVTPDHGRCIDDQ